MTVSYNHPDFLDAGKLITEQDRVFALCADCRLCVKYCDTFPIIFDAIDAQVGEDGFRTGEESVTVQVRDQAVDACFGCQACYTNCPYTPGEHDWDIDFPLLMLRSKAVNAEQKGVTLRDRVLTDPDFAGSMSAGVFNSLANAAMKPGSIHRKAAEWALGIDRRKHMPAFATKGFSKTEQAKAANALAEARTPTAPTEGAPPKDYLLFPSCTGEWNDHETPKAMLDLFEQAGCTTKTSYPGCCGMPALDTGDLERARKMARKVVKALLPEVRAGRTLVVTNPTCGLMIRNEYPELIPDEPGLDELLAATRDAGAVLFGLVKSKDLGRDFKAKPTDMVFHAPCHLQRSKVGFKGRDMLRIFKGKITMADRCSCHDGTWAMKKDHFEDSLRIGRALFDVVESEADAVVMSECPLAALHIEQATGRKVHHPAVVLRDAYQGGSSFDQSPKPDEDIT